MRTHWTLRASCQFSFGYHTSSILVGSVVRSTPDVTCQVSSSSLDATVSTTSPLCHRSSVHTCIECCDYSRVVARDCLCILAFGAEFCRGEGEGSRISFSITRDSGKGWRLQLYFRRPRSVGLWRHLSQPPQRTTPGLAQRFLVVHRRPERARRHLRFPRTPGFSGRAHDALSRNAG